MAKVDVSIIHGDGAMVGNGIIPRTDLFLAYVIKKHFGGRVIICNHTADFNHPDLREIAANVYPMFDDVVFRDQTSMERCRGICKGRFAPDTAFLFEPLQRERWAPLAGRPTYFDVWPDTADFDPAKPYLCIGGSSKLWFEEERPSPVRLGYVALIAHLRSVYEGQIVLTASDLTDESVFRPLARELGLPLIPVSHPCSRRSLFWAMRRIHRGQVASKHLRPPRGGSGHPSSGEDLQDAGAYLAGRSVVPVLRCLRVGRRRTVGFRPADDISQPGDRTQKQT
jgi:hypothetical protein